MIFFYKMSKFNQVNFSVYMCTNVCEITIIKLKLFNQRKLQFWSNFVLDNNYT